MEDPAWQAGSDIDRANGAGTAEATDDQKILIGGAWRVQADARGSLHIQAGPKVNGAILPEVPDHLAGFRIQRVEMITDAGEESLFGAGFILPEHQTALSGRSASGPFGLRIPF